jgi:hypothetical protein
VARRDASNAAEEEDHVHSPSYEQKQGERSKSNACQGTNLFRFTQGGVNSATTVDDQKSDGNKKEDSAPESEELTHECHNDKRVFISLHDI